MPANKKDFPKTSLHLRIKKGQNFDEERQKKFEELCRFFELEPWNINSVEGEWKQLSHLLIARLIPGFELNKSGANKLGKDFDREIADRVLVHRAFDSLEKPNPFHNRVKVALQQVADEKGLEFHQARAARNRHIKNIADSVVDYPDCPHLDDWPEDDDLSWTENLSTKSSKKKKSIK